MGCGEWMMMMSRRKKEGSSGEGLKSALLTTPNHNAHDDGRLRDVHPRRNGYSRECLLLSPPRICLRLEC